MKCPLSFRTMYATEPGVTIFGGDCLKEECAWWFVPTERCSILELAIHIREADARLGQLIHKMPHEEQFRK